MRILTWNIQWGRGMDGLVDLDRITRQIMARGPFDIICLQEVAVNFPGLPGCSGEDGMARLAAGLPGYEAVYAPATDLPAGGGRRSQFGNALFSRLPVLQVFRHLLPWPVDPNVPSMQRVLLEAVVSSPFGPVRMQTTHLEYYSQAQRVAQIDAIRHLHAEACAHARTPRVGEQSGGPFDGPPRPATAVLCGDMNFPASAKERLRLLAPIADGCPPFSDAWRWLHTNDPHPATVGIHRVDWVDQPSCYDFFFLTEDLAPRLRSYDVDRETSASDHQPVWIDLA